jgi:hypothetical protein
MKNIKLAMKDIEQKIEMLTEALEEGVIPTTLLTKNEGIIEGYVNSWLILEAILDKRR